MTEPDDQPVQPPKPEVTPPAPARRNFRVATHLPHTLIIGDLTITPEGTAVPSNEVDDVLAVAATNGVPVYLMED